MADARVVEKARRENRVVLTHDLDFGRLLALSGEGTPSVITFRLSDMRPQSVLEGLSLVLAEYRDALEGGAAAVVGNRGVRCRQLPIVRNEE
jgi:predicted nuclease of predicted toxin-antitoxin system